MIQNILRKFQFLLRGSTLSPIFFRLRNSSSARLICAYLLLMPFSAIATPINVNSLAAAEWAALRLDARITNVSINGNPVVDFTVTDGAGTPVEGLGNTSLSPTATVAAYRNLAFTLAKLVPGVSGGQSKWISYIVTSVATTTASVTASRPIYDNTGTLLDYGNGNYRYTFYRDITNAKNLVAGLSLTAPNIAGDLGDLVYNPNLTHRLVIDISGNARGTGTNTANGSDSGVAPVPLKNPVNLIYDFIPATGVRVSGANSGREVVRTSACLECHYKFVVHGGSRQDTRYCVVCHTDQRKYGNLEASKTATGYSGATYKIDNRAVGDMTAFVHRTHMGEHLTKAGYNYANILFNGIKYPQNIDNCVKCHDGTAGAKNRSAQGDNWKTVPSKVGCGSCHDGIDWATGKGTALGASGKVVGGHVGGAQSSDSNCALCHDSSANSVYHAPVTPPSSVFAGWDGITGGNDGNAAWLAAFLNGLPAAASQIAYELSSITVNSNRNAVVRFRVLKDGAGVAFNTYSPVGKTELIDGFVGSPSIYIAFAVPQDGIIAPSDFNVVISGHIKSLWNGSATGTSAGTLTGPDASGYYIATLTGAVIPINAVMVTGGIGYSYLMPAEQPLTQINVPGYAYNATNKTGGLTVVAPAASLVATGYTGRRQVVESARCNSCHAYLGANSPKAFHAGQRNDAATCAWCHTPNRTSSGWSADSGAFVHGIHAAAKRSVPYTWRATNSSTGFWQIGYSGVLSMCEQCHLPDTYNYGAPGSAVAVPGMLYRTVGAGTYSVYPGGPALSPYVSSGVDYGLPFAVNTATGTATAAADTTLVNAPISSACFSCHDTAPATAHMQLNGGAIYESRSTALNKVEQCLVCHGPGKVSDVKTIHSGLVDQFVLASEPYVATTAATGVTATGATLNGNVVANGAGAGVTFEYGKNSSYGTRSAAAPAIVPALSGSTVSLTLSGLECNTTYHFRVNGINNIGESNGSDLSFNTSACPPGAPVVGNVTFGPGIAYISFTPSPNGGAPTSYTATCTAPNHPARSGSGLGSPIGVSGLAGGVTYSCSIVATNGSGSSASSAPVIINTPKRSFISSILMMLLD